MNNAKEVQADLLIQDLRRLSVETGSLACLGCGHENSCGIHGCALIKKVIERLESLSGNGSEDGSDNHAGTSADEMFQELGYFRNSNYKSAIVYQNSEYVIMIQKNIFQKFVRTMTGHAVFKRAEVRAIYKLMEEREWREWKTLMGAWE